MLMVLNDCDYLAILISMRTEHIGKHTLNRSGPSNDGIRFSPNKMCVKDKKKNE